MTNQLIDDLELRKVAFDLLSSSTVSRYIRMARAAASRYMAQRQSVAPIGIADTLLPRGRFLWREVIRNVQRQPEEVELAVAIVLLARTSNDDAGTFLTTIAVSVHPPAAWLAALARRALAEQVKTTSVRLGAATAHNDEPVAWDVVLDTLASTSVQSAGIQNDSSSGATDQELTLEYA